MTEEHIHHEEVPESDHLPHTAPPEPHPVRKNLWQRWMAWSGSFLVLSIVAHVVVLGGATFLVVKVVEGRKEKLKFTAPPPSPAGPAEHKVKPSKKTAASAPAVSKRIISTAPNASIALPSMEMSSSGPDVMASVMSGLGESGLGSGIGGAAGGMASMPMAGLTAFGFKGGGGGLKGYFYDLKQTPDHKLTDIKAGGDSLSVKAHTKVMDEFFKSGWDEKLLEKYYRSRDPLVTYQVFIPVIDANKAPEAFDVQREVKPSHWIVLYKGTVTAPKDGSFRFHGFGDDTLAVRFNGQNVFLSNLQRMETESLFIDSSVPKRVKRRDIHPGKWFQVERGKTYPIEILISEVPGGYFKAVLVIEERQPDKPYAHRTFQGAESNYAYPVFQTRKGTPIPPYVKPSMTPPPNNPKGWEPEEDAPEVAPDPVIFQAK